MCLSKMKREKNKDIRCLLVCDRFGFKLYGDNTSVIESWRVRMVFDLFKHKKEQMDANHDRIILKKEKM